MNTTVTNAITFLMSRGLTKDQAVGICAVLYVESQLNPQAENNSGTDAGGVLNSKGAYGIAQWNGPRQAALANFASRENLSPSDINTQLQFILTESANSYPEVWAAIQNPKTTYQEMITVMVDHYEVPADKPAEIAKATANAQSWYPLVGAPVAPITVPLPVASAPNAVAIAQIQDAIAILQSLLKNLGAPNA